MKMIWFLFLWRKNELWLNFWESLNVKCTNAHMKPKINIQTYTPHTQILLRYKFVECVIWCNKHLMMNKRNTRNAPIYAVHYAHYASVRKRTTDEINSIENEKVFAIHLPVCNWLAQSIKLVHELRFHFIYIYSLR